MRFISKKINLLTFQIVFSERNPNSIQIQALNPDPEIDHCMAYFIENFIENYEDLTDTQIVNLIKKNDEFKNCYQEAVTAFGL
jgi:hypothetical protein